MLTLKTGRAIARLLALLALMVAFFFITRAPASASVCCSTCDDLIVVCYAHCPGSGGNSCEANCQGQYESCESTCYPDPCF
jgi:hypothetical protein